MSFYLAGCNVLYIEPPKCVGWNWDCFMFSSAQNCQVEMVVLRLGVRLTALLLCGFGGLCLVRSLGRIPLRVVLGGIWICLASFKSWRIWLMLQRDQTWKRLLTPQNQHNNGKIKIWRCKYNIYIYTVYFYDYIYIYMKMVVFHCHVTLFWGTWINLKSMSSHSPCTAPGSHARTCIGRWHRNTVETTEEWSSLSFKEVRYNEEMETQWKHMKPEMSSSCIDFLDSFWWFHISIWYIPKKNRKETYHVYDVFLWDLPGLPLVSLVFAQWSQDLTLKQLLISQLWRPDWFPEFATLSCLFGAKKGCCLSETLVFRGI